MGNFGERLASMRLGPIRYNAPMTQVILVGFVCFCTPGMFNALNTMGAGGIGDKNIGLYDTMNAVLYALFFFSGCFISGSVNNIFGPRITLFIGTCGYCVYIGSLWSYQLHQTDAFCIVAGAILGFTAGLLWAAQGAIMMSYPAEKDKGRAFGIFWAVFSLGAVVGASIALGIQSKSPDNTTVSTAVYLALLIIMIVGVACTWLVLPPNYIIRSDGTLVETEAALTPREELRQFLYQFKDWRIIMLTPMFFFSNYFYAYQGAIVSFMFNARTRTLSSLVTNIGAVLGGLAVGFLLDLIPAKRRTRAIVGWVIVFLFLCGTWGGGLSLQLTFTRKTEMNPWDWGQGKAPQALGLLFCYYFADALYQGLAYYIMASLTNDSFKLARMTGYYKGIQSAGAAVSFGMDAVKTPFLTEHLVSWLFMLFALPLALVVIFTIKESNYETEGAVHVEDLDGQKVHAAIPKGHHVHQTFDTETANGSEGDVEHKHYDEHSEQRT